jgi:hypothetical protein
MIITSYDVTTFKYEIIIDIQRSLKTALYPVLISEMPSIIFFFTNLSVSPLILFKNFLFLKIFRGPRNSAWLAAGWRTLV